MNPAVMLTLVALTYRGCEYNLANAHSHKIVYDEVARCLRNDGPEPGKWTIVWGPAGYRPTTANPDNMDISEMYAVSDGHSNLAIVLRGTNLFSALDWTSNLLIDEEKLGIWRCRSGGENLSQHRAPSSYSSAFAVRAGAGADRHRE